MGKHYLGQIELLNGQMLNVEYTRGLFLTHCFRERSNWGILKNILNIMLKEYMTRFPSKKAFLIEDMVEVITQYDYFLGKTDKITEDAKITEASGKETCVEFQNGASVEVPISTRALQKFLRGFSPWDEKISNQIWFLTEDDEDLLHGRVFTNYTLRERISNHSYPNPSGIMYISLNCLAQDDCQAGELASLLLGKNSNPKDGKVKEIADGLKKHFEKFKEDEEVKLAMTRLEEERIRAESVGEAGDEEKKSV